MVLQQIFKVLRFISLHVYTQEAAFLRLWQNDNKEMFECCLFLRFQVKNVYST